MGQSLPSFQNGCDERHTNGGSAADKVPTEIGKYQEVYATVLQAIPKTKSVQTINKMGSAMVFDQGRSAVQRSDAKAAPRASLAWHSKRLLDIILATTSLLLLSPLIVLAAAAVKLESSGSVFCREIRFGYSNQPIRTLKFRTTMSSTEPTRIRSRVTWVGRVLRYTGIGGVPQLINVLLGDMSIVGPRAYACQQDGHFRALLDGFKPGLIGWVQLLEARNGLMTADQRVAVDLHYAKHWSLLLDLKIISMTFFVAYTAHPAA
jgi:lipopolysaccharide/colanic/teichoic acid biosynthesis glycosyltransferase